MSLLHNRSYYVSGRSCERNVPIPLCWDHFCRLSFCVCGLFGIVLCLLNATFPPILALINTTTFLLLCIYPDYIKIAPFIPLVDKLVEVANIFIVERPWVAPSMSLHWLSMFALQILCYFFGVQMRLIWSSFHIFLQLIFVGILISRMTAAGSVDWKLLLIFYKPAVGLLKQLQQTLLHLQSETNAIIHGVVILLLAMVVLQCFSAGATISRTDNQFFTNVYIGSILIDIIGYEANAFGFKQYTVPADIASHIANVFFRAYSVHCEASKDGLIALSNQYPLAEIFLIILFYEIKENNRAENIAEAHLDGLFFVAQTTANHPTKMYVQYVLGYYLGPLEGLKYLEMSACQGYDFAQLSAGDRYTSLGKDLPKAVHYYTLSAVQGNAIAQFKLGNCYFNGTGIEKDMTKAVQYFQLSADQGQAVAQYNLGICFLNGYGTEEDKTKALQYFQLAATQGQVEAQFNLGICYLDGKGTEKDAPKALQYMQLAADQGYAAAQEVLASSFYYSGIEVEKDFMKAFHYLELSAKQNNAKAQYNLGTLYEQGEGVTRDERQAFAWYEKAANNGFEQAKIAMTRCQQAMIERARSQLRSFILNDSPTTTSTNGRLDIG